MKFKTMKIKSLLIIAGSIFIASSVLAQDNLVDNGGFESTTGKAKKLGQIDMATGWKSPTGVRADFYVGDGKVPEIGTPDNFYGKEDPKEGENYAGIMAYSYNNKLPRSYVSAKLNTTLKKDVYYCVSFWVSLSEASKYACNQIGANLSKKEFGTDQKVPLIDKAQILHPDNKVFNATFGWVRVCGTFKAEGGEKFITIGNFYSNEDTKYEALKKPKDSKINQVIGAYYYIDDVVVKMLDEGQECDCYTDDKAKEETSMIYMKQVVDNEKMSPKDRIERQGVYFGFGKATLTTQAQRSLDLIAKVIKENPSLSVTLYGHSDTKEEEMAEKKPAFDNMDQKRIDAVMDYLKSKGVQTSQIKTVASDSSESNPEIVDSDEEELKFAKNRRVNFKVN